MLTRRHIRVKVMQCIYALNQSKEESLDKQQKFLRSSIEDMYALYLLVLGLLAAIHDRASTHLRLSSKKYLSGSSDAYPDKEKFINNALLLQIADNKVLKAEMDRRKLKTWYLNEEYVKLIHKEIVRSPIYDAYMRSSQKGYEKDRQFLIDIFREVIAPNDKVYDFFEDDTITWVDDMPIINTFVLKLFKKAKETSKYSFFLPRLLKDKVMDFAQDLLDKTLLNDGEWVRQIEGKTPNWDKDRIAEVDAILLKMAICELLNFPSIPEKVTL
ncbi:MAG: transcription antitermination factor NusB, partial [Bacteroidota bacterium]